MWHMELEQPSCHRKATHMRMKNNHTKNDEATTQDPRDNHWAAAPALRSPPFEQCLSFQFNRQMVLAAECIPKWHNEQSTLENETRGSLSRGGICWRIVINLQGWGQSQEREGPLNTSPEKPRVIQLSLTMLFFYNSLYRCHFSVLDDRAGNFSRESTQ